MNLIDKFYMPIDDALRKASVYAGRFDKDIDWKVFDKKAMRRIKIYNLGEWWHWWRWFYFFKTIKHKIRMWLSRNGFRCRCVTHYQDTGKHAEHCPKSKPLTKRFFKGRT